MFRKSLSRSARASMLVLVISAVAGQASAAPIWEEYADSIGAPKGKTSSVGTCSKAKGTPAYKRCLEYLSMAGTPTQRDLARRSKNMMTTCHYSHKHGETVCTDSTALKRR